MFFQHFLLQTKPKEYNPEQEVLLTRDPSPALAAERYPGQPGLLSPITAPSLPDSAFGAAGEQSVTQSMFPVMVLTDDETSVFFRSQKERILKQFLRRGSFSSPKIELGSWEPVAGRRV